MINFLGNGSAFNTSKGNTCAYLKKDQHLLLIDCGGLAFHQAKENGLFEDVKKITVVITHTHPDHVGSLGEVIFYAYYALKILPELHFPDQALLETFLRCIGIEPELYTLFDELTYAFIENPLELKQVDFIPVTHVDTIPSYGFVMRINNDSFYYSGDSNQLSEAILQRLIEGDLDRIYQDTCGLDYEGNNHLYYKKLVQMVPEAYRQQVYCIHLDAFITEEELVGNGFCIGK